MENWQAIFTGATFLGVIFLFVTEWVHLTITALLGALLLVVVKIMTLAEAMEFISQSHATLGLFFGMMVIVRAFEPTQVFEYLGVQMVIFAQGKGSRLLLAIVGITSLVSAFLPNATTVMLLARLLRPTAGIIGVDFVPLLILMVFVANSAGLLTLISDPTTFLVGDAINISFRDYLIRLSLGGAIAIGIILMTLPFLFRKIWRKKLENVDLIVVPQINHPRILIIGLIIITFVLTLFVIGDSLPITISPATVALLGAAFSLLVVHHSRITSVNQVLQDIDWSTLIFFMAIFVLIGGLQKTEVIAGVSGILALVLGKNIVLGSILLLFFTGLVSSFVPNTPVVVAMIPLLKEYIVTMGMAPPEILAASYRGQLPLDVLPLFYALLYGATLGGNGTLIGSSSNIVAAGISEIHGKRISFKTFLCYGVPTAMLQLSAAALYIFLRFLL